MKPFSKKTRQEEAICPSCGEWKTTDFTPEELREKEWECSDCQNKRLTNPQDLPENRGLKEISKYDPEYSFLIKLIKLITAEGVPPQEIKTIAEAYPFVTVDDVGDLTAKIWTLATEKYKIPREWLIKKLPKNASLKHADLWPAQEQAQDMLSHTHNSLSYNNDQEPDTSVSGPRPDEVGKEAESLNINQIVQILNAKDTNKVVRIDTKNLSLDLSDGTEISFDDAAKKAMDMSKTATGEFTGAEFSGTDASPNPLTDIGPWSSPEDYGKKPQKSPFPNSNWLPADDENLDQQPASNVAASKNDSHGQCARSEATWRVKLFDGRGVQYFPSEELANKYYEVALKEKKDPSKPQPFTYNKEASLKKEAIQQQDVVDFYLLSLLPPEYLNQEVSPDHYDALSIFKGIIESLRNEYIERGMEELVDEAETTAWTKAIPESDMPEEIKKYYTFHDGPFPGRNYHSDPDDEDYDSEPNYDSTCDNCGTGLYEDEVYNFNDGIYCIDCEGKAIQDAIKENVAFCETHKVFVTDDRNLKEHLHGYKFDSWDKHHDNGVCNVVRFDAGKQIWQEMEENAKNQLQMELGDRKKRREEKPKQLKFRPVEDDGTAPNQLGGDDDPIPGPTASLKQAGEGRYMGGDSDGWWEAPTHFGDYTAQDFYTIFEHAPWKHLYGGPAWAEIAKTIYQMEQTTDWQKLVVLIDHFHDLGHNTGKLLDKFPEWHQWFRKLLDEKAKKNSIRYLLPKASKPVQNLVTDFLKIHGRDWREDEGKKTEELPDTKFHIGEQVIMDRKAGTIKEVSRMDLERPLYVVQFDDGSKSRWAQDDELQPMPAVHSSFNRPFSKKAVLPSKFWIAPDGTEFPMGGVHGHWIENNLKKLKQYGIDAKGKNLIQIWNEMIETGWARVSNEPAGTRFIIEVNDLSNLPPYLDSFIAKYYTQGEEITLGNGKGQYVKVNDPFPSIQKAVNKELTNPINASLKQAAIRGDITNKILQAIHNNGGVTYNLTQGEIKEGFVVSTHLDREQIVDGVDFDILEGYIENNQDLLSDPNNSFGAWTNNGKVFLDVVTVVPDKEKALELGREHGQLAIWDLAGNQELYTGVQRNVAFSKKDLIKKAEESLLSQVDQNEIAAASSPAYVIATNNYAEAVKRGHSKDRSLEYAIESVQNLEKVDPKKLVEFINKFVVI